MKFKKHALLLLCCTALLTGCESAEETSSSDSEVTITVSGTTRSIVSNGIPDHGLDEDTDYINELKEQTLTYEVTTEPSKNDDTTSYTEPQKFGVAINGIPLDPFTAEYYKKDKSSGWHIEATGGNLGLDKYGAHIQRDGTYHYHSIKTDFFTAFGVTSSTHSPLIGYAADGFPVYGPIENGVKITNNDLDDYHGHTSITADFPNGIYHYHITDEDPYINGNGYFGTPGNISH